VGPTELPNVWTALAIASDQTPLLHACLLHHSRDAQGFPRIEVTESGEGALEAVNCFAAAVI